MKQASIRIEVVPFLLLAGLLAGLSPGVVAAPTPQSAQVIAGCSAGDNPEPSAAAGGMQGRRFTGAFSQQQTYAGHLPDGRPAGSDQDITCNTRALAQFTVRGSNTGLDPTGSVGGFKTHRYVDSQGNECAIYDSTLLYPTNIFDLEGGVNVLQVSRDAAGEPTLKYATTLRTPAMLSPHESLVLSEEKGILAAVLGNPSLGPGVVDVYDLSANCTEPELRASAPVGVFGHEGGMSPDGRIFWSASPSTPTLTAVDITEPFQPRPIWTGPYSVHGMNISNDGNTAYLAYTPRDNDESQFKDQGSGLLILDVSEVNAAAGDPTKFGHPFPGQDPSGRTSEPNVTEIGYVTWDNVTIPQNAIPVTIQGRDYVIEVDEFSQPAGGGSVAAHGPRVGAARIIDIADPANPKVLSDLRLAVHEPENRAAIANDPGAQPPVQGYAGHYCAVPTRDNPTIVACGMIVSGLRVFDIRDPANPVETAYFNPAIPPRFTPYVTASNWAMSAPAFFPERKEIWYTDGFAGFFIVRVNDEGWPDWENGDDGADPDRHCGPVKSQGREKEADHPGLVNCGPKEKKK